MHTLQDRSFSYRERSYHDYSDDAYDSYFAAMENSTRDLWIFIAVIVVILAGIIALFFWLKWFAFLALGGLVGVLVGAWHLFWWIYCRKCKKK